MVAKMVFLFGSEKFFSKSFDNSILFYSLPKSNESNIKTMDELGIPKVDEKQVLT